MGYDYYEIDGGTYNRLFRVGIKTNTEERWDTTERQWVHVAPAMTDRLCSGDPFLDELTQAQAEAKYPDAFHGEESWALTEHLMNRIQVAIMRNEPFEDFLQARRVPAEGIPEVKEFWDALSAEMSEPLPPGQVWDVRGE